jgi:UDP-glucose:(heptosyl)LPS alpha-1,3-glucosyltransferase
VIVEIPIDVWDPSRGGAEGYLLRMARGLAARGHRVRVLCLRANPSFLGEVEVERLPAPRWPRWLRELAFARAALARRAAGGADVTLAVRHALAADVYQPHGGPFRKALRASLEGVEPPLLRNARGALRSLRPKTRVLLWLDREILRRSPDLITISLSRRVEEDFRESYPGLPMRFERIYNGVDLAEFHDRDRVERARTLRAGFAIPPKDRVALFVAHKFGPKGLLDAIRALPGAEGFHLVVLGDGRRGPFQSEARARGVEGRVHFAGQSDEPRLFYAGADAFILPTRYDPCSLSVLEALACGTAVVTTTANGAGELIEPGVEGFVTAPGDVPALAGGLREIAARWEAFHAAALARARGLSFEDHLEKLEAVLLRAAEERRRRIADCGLRIAD